MSPLRSLRVLATETIQIRSPLLSAVQKTTTRARKPGTSIGESTCERSKGSRVILCVALRSLREEVPW